MSRTNSEKHLEKLVALQTINLWLLSFAIGCALAIALL